MRINVEKMLKIQANEFIKDADFAYDDDSNDLNNENGHMIAQKTLLRVNVLNSFLENITSEDELQKSTQNLSRKMLKQVQEDVDYMYPNESLEESNIHLVMQLIKRTGEDLGNFLDCFQQKHEMESKINLIEILKEQFIEYNNDLDYAYPNNNYEEDNAHIVIQGLLGKSEFLYYVIDNTVVVNEEEKEFKNIYLDKMSGLIELLNSGYNHEGVYQNNGHDIFSTLIEGLKVEIKDLSEIRIRDNQELNYFETETETVKTNSIPTNEIKKDNASNISNEIQAKEEDIEEKPIRNEEVKKKLKNMM